MAIHTDHTQEQRWFLENVERAQFAGVTTKTSQSVRQALLTDLSCCNFGHATVSLTADFLVACQDWLADKAIEMGKDEEIKWVGFPR